MTFILIPQQINKKTSVFKRIFCRKSIKNNPENAAGIDFTVVCYAIYRNFTKKERLRVFSAIRDIIGDNSNNYYITGIDEHLENFLKDEGYIKTSSERFYKDSLYEYIKSKLCGGYSPEKTIMCLLDPDGKLADFELLQWLKFRANTIFIKTRYINKFSEIVSRFEYENGALLILNDSMQVRTPCDIIIITGGPKPPSEIARHCIDCRRFEPTLPKYESLFKSVADKYHVKPGDLLTALYDENIESFKQKNH
ncbi:MAG: hypothetical protein Q8865_05755 [Bacillota bacterium]|nr:hypothetical protein [Bacillota bacterium]